MTVHTAPLIIMLSGWAGSGKDTAANILIEEMGFRRYAFADMIKEVCSRQYNIPREYFYDVELKDEPLDASLITNAPNILSNAKPLTTPRDLLIAYGAKARAEDASVFVRNTVTAIQADGHERIVITDWRFPNEFKYMRDAFFASHVMPVRIRRPGIVPTEDPSERSLDDMIMEELVDNDGSIEDLRCRLRALMSPYMETLFRS